MQDIQGVINIFINFLYKQIHMQCWPKIMKCDQNTAEKIHKLVIPCIHYTKKQLLSNVNSVDTNKSSYYMSSQWTA